MPFVLAIDTKDELVPVESGLTATVLDGECVLPFSTLDNAIDCMRLLVRSLEDLRVENGGSL